MRHPSLLLRFSSVFLALMVILMSISLPDLLDNLELPLLLMSVFLIGIPHGAIDHVMASEIFKLKRTLSGHLTFYGSYLLVMLFVGAIWVWIPVAGMLLFLLISVYHFGQADMEDFMHHSSTLMSTLYAIVRGLFIIGFIIFSDLTITVPVIADAIHVDSATLYASLPDPVVALSIFTIVYVGVMLSAALYSSLKSPLFFLFDSLILGTMFLTAGPLIGFAIYFAMWHSAGHVQEMREFFEEHGKKLSLARFYWLATPFTVISLIGLFLLWGINQAFRLEEQMLTLMFILISVLTLPHMLIVDRMYNGSTSSDNS